MKYFSSILFLFISINVLAQKSANLDSLIGSLTLQEKAYLVIGSGMDIPGMTSSEKAPTAVVGSSKGKVPGAAGTSYTLKNRNLPIVVFADGPAGIRIDPKRENEPDKSFYATAFPVGSLLASSWNPELMEKVGEAFGEEAKAYGVDFVLAPALNIQRNPLGGRNFEYYSEDPVLAGKLAAGFVRGVQNKGVGATIKHFVANNSETNRTALNTVVSERALREIYLKGFEIAIKEGHPWALMSSYNKINGVYASENKDLLTGLLRDEWNYKGFVMTDWFAGKDPVAQVKAGNDLLMPGTIEQANKIIAAVKNGSLDENLLNRNIKYILKQYQKTPSFHDEAITNSPDLDAHKSTVRNAASEGMVLLKNEAVLPINPEKIALFGVASYQTISGGTGSGDVNKAYIVNINEGLKKAGFKVDTSVSREYRTYIKTEEAKIPKKQFFFEPDILVPEKSFSEEELTDVVSKNEIGVYTISRTSGEFFDRKKKMILSLKRPKNHKSARFQKLFTNKIKNWWSY